MQQPSSSVPDLHLSPPLSSPARNPHATTWRPYSKTPDFDANAAMILIILVSALICALALNAAIRCVLRQSRRQPQLPDRLPETEPHKLTHAAAAATETASPTLVFSAGIKLAGAEAECAICLSEFVNGDRVRVLSRCRHGFHVKCIEKWLFSHASCPTCRSNCLTTSPGKNMGIRGDDVDLESPPEIPERGLEQPRE